jgi:dihydroorotase
MFIGGIRPHYYCLPVAKREAHRAALVKAATSGEHMFFLGTDTAPHSRAAKESACGCAGIFTAPNALPLYAQAFDEAGQIAKLEGFASRFGPAFYGLPVNNDLIKLEKAAPTGPDIKPILTGDGQEIVAFAPLSPLLWRIVEA